MLFFVTDREQVTQYIEGLSCPRKEMCLQIRALLLEANPPLEELWRWSRPVYRLNGKYIAYFVANKGDVNFGFEAGATLQDPKGLLLGTGKSMRHLKLKKLEDLDIEYAKRLLAEAIRGAP